MSPVRLRRREAAVVAALVDAVVAPEPPLPPVRRTDAVAAFGAWFAAGPAVSRVVVRAALAALAGAGFTRRGRAGRLAALRRRDRLPPARSLADALRSVAAVAYYGDAGVLRLLGYDAQVRVRDGRERRARELGGGA